MDTQDEKDAYSLIKEAIKKSRGYASHFEWPLDRDLEEWGIVKDFCESFEKTGDILLNKNTLSSRGRGNDPPDCDALDNNKNKIGIEVTELVDPAAITAFKNGRIYDWADWDKNKLVNAIENRLSAKDTPERIKGGPYYKYYLVIHTSEPVLTIDFASKILADHEFLKRSLIDRAFILFSYEPQYKIDPFLELKFKGI